MKALQDKIFGERKHLSSKINGGRKLSPYKGTIFSIEIWFLDNQNLFYLIVRGLKNVTLLHRWAFQLLEYQWSKGKFDTLG